MCIFVIYVIFCALSRVHTSTLLETCCTVVAVLRPRQPNPPFGTHAQTCAISPPCITSFCETASGTHECVFQASPAWCGVADQSDLTWFDLGCAPPAPSAVAGQLRARLAHTAARAEGHQGLPPGPVQPSAPRPLLSALSDSSDQMFRPNGTFDADSFGFYFLIFNAIPYAINFANIL